MSSTPVSTIRTPDWLILPSVEWPSVSDLPFNIDYPEFEEDTVEIELQRF